MCVYPCSSQCALSKDTTLRELTIHSIFTQVDYFIGFVIICGITVANEIGENCKRLLWVEEERTKTALGKFFTFFGEARTEALRFICSDMWKNYLEVIADRAKNAINVLDRFHIVKILNKKIDKVRAAEVKRLEKDGKDPILTRSRWCFLKRPENLTDKQELKLADILRYNLRTVRAYLLKEECVAGSFNLETRYPFLDKKVVQEFLWLTPELKNSHYKSVLHNYLTKNSFPFNEGKKTGF